MTESAEPNVQASSSGPRRRGRLLRPSVIAGVAAVVAILVVSFFVGFPPSHSDAQPVGNSSAAKARDQIQSLPGVKTVTDLQSQNAGSGTQFSGYLTVETNDGLTGNSRLALLNQISDDLASTESGAQVFAEVHIQNMVFGLSGVSGQDNAARLAVSEALQENPSVTGTSIALPDSSNSLSVTVYSTAAVSPLDLFDTVQGTVNAGLPNVQLIASLLPSATSQSTPSIFSAAVSASLPLSVAGIKSVSLPAMDPVSDGIREQVSAVQSAPFITGYQLVESADGTFLQAAVTNQTDASRVRALFSAGAIAPNVSGIGLFYPDANGNQIYEEL